MIIKGLNSIYTWEYWNSVSPSFGIILAAIVVALISYWFVKWGLNFLPLHKKNNSFLQSLNKYWQGPLFIVFLLAFQLSIEPFITLPRQYDAYYSHALTLLTIMLITWGIIAIIYTFRDLVTKHLFQTAHDQFDMRRTYTKANILLKVTALIVGLIGFSLALMTFPKVQQIGVSILASAGIAGIIIGLAAQKSLGNVLAGIQIALTQPIRIDDVVIVEEEWGTIEEITLTYVVVRIWDKRRLILPINYFIEKPFQNWTRISTDLLGTIFVEVDYTAPIQEIRKALHDILQTTDLWDQQVTNLSVTDAKAQTIQLRALVSASDASKLWDLRCYVREKLIDFLQQNFPQCLPKARVDVKNRQNVSSAVNNNVV
jgi:small-conductance mechanosensitive channel